MGLGPTHHSSTFWGKRSTRASIRIGNAAAATRNPSQEMRAPQRVLRTLDPPQICYGGGTRVLLGATESRLRIAPTQNPATVHALWTVLDAPPLQNWLLQPNSGSHGASTFDPMLLKFQTERRPCRVLNIAWSVAPLKPMTLKSPSPPPTVLASAKCSPLLTIRFRGNSRNCLLAFRKSRAKRFKTKSYPLTTEISDDGRGLFKTCRRVPTHGEIFQRQGEQAYVALYGRQMDSMCRPGKAAGPIYSEKGLRKCWDVRSLYSAMNHAGASGTLLPSRTLTAHRRVSWQPPGKRISATGA
jgi:hypothetical protein